MGVTSYLPNWDDPPSSLWKSLCWYTPWRCRVASFWPSPGVSLEAPSCPPNSHLCSFEILKFQVVATQFVFCYFHPESLGKSSNLTSIFFKGVGEKPPARVVLISFEKWPSDMFCLSVFFSHGFLKQRIPHGDLQGLRSRRNSITWNFPSKIMAHRNWEWVVMEPI